MERSLANFLLIAVLCSSVLVSAPLHNQQQDTSHNDALIRSGQSLLPRNTVQALGPRNFISVWDTTKVSSGPTNKVKLPLINGGNYNFNVSWGDTVEEVVTSKTATHTYSTGGNYTIVINGTIDGWSFNNGGDVAKLLEIAQWGDLKLGDGGNYFQGATNLVLTATDAPDLSGTITLQSAFQYCKNLGNQGNMNSWNTSTVTNMDLMFDSATTFNQPVGNWNTTGVTSMAVMFGGAYSFNQPLDSWDLSHVTDTDGMFDGASTFNQPLSSWDVSNVQFFDSMFQNAASFNQNINAWDVSKGEIFGMFWGAISFNQPLDNWNITGKTDLTSMFQNATSFDQDISGWNISSVSILSGFLLDAGVGVVNYDKLLNAWAQQAVQSGVTFDAGSSRYSSFGNVSRDILITNHTWTINDGGMAYPASKPLTPAANVVGNTIELSWNAPTSDNGTQILSYSIFRSSTSGSGYSKIGTSPTLSYVDTTAPHAATSYYVIAADNGAGLSNYSIEISAFLPAGTPNPPLNPTATAGDGVIQLAWSAPSDNGGTPITTYTVYRTTTSGSGYTFLANSTTLSYSDNAIDANITYYYVITATNSFGESAHSVEVSAKVAVPGTGSTNTISSGSTNTTTTTTTTGTGTSSTGGSGGGSSNGWVIALVVIVVLGGGGAGGYYYYTNYYTKKP